VTEVDPPPLPFVTVHDVNALEGKLDPTVAPPTPSPPPPITFLPAGHVATAVEAAFAVVAVT
jgi:hypothetical protein